ncbi:MAG: DUF2306 domain-containing protein [Pseudomonadota bacterium]
MSQSEPFPKPHTARVWLGGAGVALLLFLSAGFILHAVGLGVEGFLRDLSGENRLYWPEDPYATAAVFFHMITGGLITGLAPLQLLGIVRRRWPAIHRWSGRVLVCLAALTGVSGLTYIALRGTIGGLDMSLSFSLNGVLMILCAVQTIRFARRRRFDRHRRWALRLAVLCIGSWLYRLHYGLWVLSVGSVGMKDDFTGAFDLVNIWAFYLPYLVALEIWFRWEARRQPAAVTP